MKLQDKRFSFVSFPDTKTKTINWYVVKEDGTICFNLKVDTYEQYMKVAASIPAEFSLKLMNDSISTTNFLK